jgi:hypothetical protein
MSHISGLQGQLDRKAIPKTKAWWEGYLKHAISFRGVKMADIRASLRASSHREGIQGSWSVERQTGLAIELIQRRNAEDSLAGV